MTAIQMSGHFIGSGQFGHGCVGGGDDAVGTAGSFGCSDDAGGVAGSVEGMNACLHVHCSVKFICRK